MQDNPNQDIAAQDVFIEYFLLNEEYNSESQTSQIYNSDIIIIFSIYSVYGTRDLLSDRNIMRLLAIHTGFKKYLGLQTLLDIVWLLSI